MAGGGRTGSHWLEQLVKFVTDYTETDLNSVRGEKWVAHSNQLDQLASVDLTRRQTCALLVIKRRDIFAQAMSFALAEHTQEWFTYSDDPVQPFDLDPQLFHARLQGCKLWNHIFDKEIRPLYSHVIDFDFEELIDWQQSVEDHVAQRLGVINPHGHKDWQVNRNPRHYTRLVRNWQILAGSANA